MDISKDIDILQDNYSISKSIKHLKNIVFPMFEIIINLHLKKIKFLKIFLFEDRIHFYFIFLRILIVINQISND